MALVTAALSYTATASEQPAYIGSDACAECHTEAAEDWAGSHHALAWTAPGPDTVVADFDGTEFAHDGMLSQFRVEEDGGYQGAAFSDATAAVSVKA